MKFKKKDFVKNFKEEEIDELYEPNGSFGGDTPHKPDADVRVKSMKAFDDKSDYEEDVSQTPEDVSANGKNSSGNHRYFNQGNSYGSVREDIKGKVRKMSENLVGKTKSKGFIDKNLDKNNNLIKDINELNNQALISKTKDFLKTLNNGASDNEEKEIVLNFIINSVSPKILNNIIQNAK